jgi:hypothetical protein
VADGAAVGLAVGVGLGVGEAGAVVGDGVGVCVLGDCVGEAVAPAAAGGVEVGVAVAEAVGVGDATMGVAVGSSMDALKPLSGGAKPNSGSVVTPPLSVNESENSAVLERGPSALPIQTPVTKTVRATSQAVRDRLKPEPPCARATAGADPKAALLR